MRPLRRRYRNASSRTIQGAVKSCPFVDSIMIVSPSMRLLFQLRTFALFLALPPALAAQQQQTDVAKGGAKQSPRGRPQDTEVWEPVPPVVTPGRVDAAPPS